MEPKTHPRRQAGVTRIEPAPPETPPETPAPAAPPAATHKPRRDRPSPPPTNVPDDN